MPKSLKLKTAIILFGLPREDWLINYDNSIFVADIKGSSADIKKIHENKVIGGLLQEMDWSPDGSKIVFAEQGNGAHYVEEELTYFHTIKILDVVTKQITPLLVVDHGLLGTNLSWSPNGEFIIYTLRAASNKSAIWWLEVSSGKTGPITNALNASSGYWKKTF